MRIKHITVTAVAFTLGVAAFPSQAYNGQDTNRAPNRSANPYWQAPDWSNLSRPPANTMAPPAYNQGYRPQRPPAPAYRPPNMNRPMPPASGASTVPPPPAGPYRSSQNVAPGPVDQGASAFNTPGYNPYRDNRRRSNKFWGRSGPSSWMNPNKGRMERGWDDMINSPSRMGRMPGGWTAPEVTMPNPVDIGDQMQDNVQDLPEQVKDMDVGN